MRTKWKEEILDCLMAVAVLETLEWKIKTFWSNKNI